MMDNSAREMVRTWDADRGTDMVQTISLPGTGHPDQGEFDRFAARFSDLAPSLTIRRTEDEQDLPGFRLADNIIYSALPLEKELAPFLEGLSCLAAPAPLDDGIQSLLDRVELPATLTLFIAVQCPHCPAMVRTLIPLAGACPQIRLHIIDGSLFPETAREQGVMAAPCLILDKDFRWTGNVAAREILAMLTDRDPSKLSADSLRTVLEQGDADWIFQQMKERQQIFDGFVELLLHPMWSVRLGAMVVVESMAEAAPSLGAALAPLLVRLFDEKDISVQGDILYALGEIGDLETRAWIRRILPSLEHPDLRDAAEDALEAIESRD